METVTIDRATFYLFFGLHYHSSFEVYAKRYFGISPVEAEAESLFEQLFDSIWTDLQAGDVLSIINIQHSIEHINGKRVCLNYLRQQKLQMGNRH